MIGWKIGLLLLLGSNCLTTNRRNELLYKNTDIVPHIRYEINKEDKYMDAFSRYAKYLKIADRMISLYKDNRMEAVTAMEALDMVKDKYADNFIKIQAENIEDYYYQLEGYDFYLVYEGKEDGYYLIHLYEFVLDDKDTGMGHTVTYGWYKVDANSGEIVEAIEY